MQCEIQRLKIQAMIKLPKNIVTLSVTLSEKRTHVERAGTVLHVHKCVKIIATLTKHSFCTEKIPVLVEGQKFSSIRYMEPITKVLCFNYTIAACNPLYPNVVKLEDSSFQQYGETLERFNREIYQWSMNSSLNVSDENLRHSFFCTSDIKQFQIARTTRHNRSEIISREAFRYSDGKESHENFIQWNYRFQQEIFLAYEITNFRNLKSEKACTFG